MIPEALRSQVTSIGDGFYRLVVSFGFMEQPLLVPALRAAAANHGIPFDPSDTSYYVGHEKIVVKDEAKLNRIPEAIFSYMNRNAAHEEKRFGMPLARVQLPRNV